MKSNGLMKEENLDKLYKLHSVSNNIYKSLEKNNGKISQADFDNILNEVKNNTPAEKLAKMGLYSSGPSANDDTSKNENDVGMKSKKLL